MKAFEKEQEKKAWQIYVSKYPHFTKDDYKPFEDFYSTKQQESDQSVIEILNDVKEIISAFKKEGENDGDI